MSENKLTLEKRTETGKKLKALRAAEKIPAVVYGAKVEPTLVAGDYNAMEKVLLAAGYHSTVDLDIAGKAQMAIVKSVDLDPVSRKILNVEFQAVSADQVVEATTPIVLTGFETSAANKLHYTLLQVMEEIDVKAKPSELPKELVIDASGLAELSDKLTVADLNLPKGVELADKELSGEQVVANLYDAAAEAAAREAADKAEAENAGTETTEEASGANSEEASSEESETSGA